MKPVECLLCRQPTTEERRRLHLASHHPIESVCFGKEPDDSLAVFFASAEIIN